MPGGGSSVFAQQSSFMDPEQQRLQERKKSKEIIHSGHFMVSDFEAEGRDDDDEVAIPVPDDTDDPNIVLGGVNTAGDLAGGSPGDVVARPKKSDASSPGLPVVVQSFSTEEAGPFFELYDSGPAVTIDQSLTKLFQCMTLAYSSKLTSPRWKNFKGLRLQWKDKIRLNNLIWRCWHMQFIERRNTAVWFASPLEVDQHNKPEAVVLEGKYWKRRLATVTAEYKKWRIFFKNQMMGRTARDLNELGMGGELDQLDWFSTGPRSNGSFNSGSGPLALDDDFFMDFTDTLFSSLSSNQPFPFPNPREIAKGAGIADFIQPGLIQLQPNLDDFMDTLEPLHELLSGRLPPVEEEIAVVEDIASRNAEQQQQRNHQQQSQLPYSSSSSISSTSSSSTSNHVVTAGSAGSGGNNLLLNYLPMEPSAPTAAIPSPSSSSSTPQYLAGNSPHFAHHHHVPTQQPESTELFSYATSAIPSASSSPSPTYEVKPNSQLIQPTGSFVATPGRSNPFDAMTPTLQRQNSAGSDHGFAVPTTQFQGKQRSRSRSGSGSTTPTNSNPPPILPHPGGLSTSQPAIALSTRNQRGKTAGGTTMSSPARLLGASGQDSSGLSRGGSRSGRARATTDLQPIMPVSVAHVSPPSAPRSILPDSSTLLAQLLTSSNTPATLVLSAMDSPTQRIPVLFPVASGESGDQASSGAVALLPNAFSPPDFKRELAPVQPAPIQSSAEEASAGAAPTNPPPSGSRAKTGSADGERTQYKEHRRVSHINAEQKRRCNIKNGFDTLQSLLPGAIGGGSSSSSSGCGSGGGSSGASGHGKSSDVSKAAMLHRGAEYIRLLRQERQQQQEEMDQLRQTIESLNTAISGCQALLPASGAPVSSRQRSNRMREMFDDWVRTRTLQNWKFWIFSILIQPLLESYSSALAASTYEDLWQNVLTWVDQYCSLIALRPVVFNSLRNLSKTTDILTNPSRLPAEATQAACNPDGRQQQQQQAGPPHSSNGALSTT